MTAVMKRVYLRDFLGDSERLMASPDWSPRIRQHRLLERAQRREPELVRGPHRDDNSARSRRHCINDGAFASQDRCRKPFDAVDRNPGTSTNETTAIGFGRPFRADGQETIRE